MVKVWLKLLIFFEETNKNKAPVGTMLHCYGGSLQLLLKGWKMLDMSFCQFICMWLCGDQAKGIPPSRLLKTIHLSNILPRATVVLCNMRYLINAVDVAAVEAGVWEHDPKMWTNAMRRYFILLVDFTHIFNREGKTQGPST